MITALMTGLGIGLAFWIVIIPILVITVRRNSVTSEKLNGKSLELLAERNKMTEETIAKLDLIQMGIWELVSSYQVSQRK